MGWPTYETPPAAAFIDVDGTLLAQTTTYLFARILRRRGLLRRSFVLRAVYHGLQHRFGRLDYGQLVNFGLKSISEDPGGRTGTDRLRQFRRVRQTPPVRRGRGALHGPPEVGDDAGPRLVVAGPGDRAAGDLPRLHRDADDAGPDPARAARRDRLGPPCYGEGKRYYAEQWAAERGISMDEAAAYADNWSDRALLERVGRASWSGPTASSPGWPGAGAGTSSAPGRPEADRRGDQAARIETNRRVDTDGSGPARRVSRPARPFEVRPVDGRAPRRRSTD